MKTKILIMFLAIGLVACGKKESIPMISDAQCVDAEKILTLNGQDQVPLSIVLDDGVEYQMTSSCAAHLQTALASGHSKVLQFLD